jgi:hypothetical protein
MAAVAMVLVAAEVVEHRVAALEQMLDTLAIHVILTMNPKAAAH